MQAQMSWEKLHSSAAASLDISDSLIKPFGDPSEREHGDLSSEVQLITTPWLDSLLGAFSYGYEGSLRAPRLSGTQSFVADSLKSPSAVPYHTADEVQRNPTVQGLDVFFLEHKAQACRDAMIKLSETGVANQILQPTRGDKIDEFVAVALRYLLPYRRTETANVANLIDEMIARYFDVAYHHVGHAALVCHNAVEIARLVGVWRLLSSDEKVTLSLIGLGHDMGHPGKGIGFLKSIGHPLTKLYNDISPLENYHAASLLQLLERPDCDIFSNISSATKTQLRRLLIQGILWTDLTEHSNYLDRAHCLLDKAAKLKASTPLLDDEDLRRAALAMCVKASDLAYMSLEPPVVMLQWAIDFYTEVFSQTSIEEELGFRNIAGVSLNQLGTSGWFLRNSHFIDSVVIPIGTYLGELESRVKDPRRGGTQDDDVWDPKQLTLAFSQVSLVRALRSQEGDLEGLAVRLAEVEACGLEDGVESLPTTPTFKTPIKKRSYERKKGWWSKQFSPPATTVTSSRYSGTNAWRALVEPSRRNAEALRKVRYFIHPT